uniref:Uncharacterized protein n=1 Tax=Anguilla anguilla TaxID=7936 RepID=A0A0E9V7S4_ANGAN
MTSCSPVELCWRYQYM